MARDFQIQGPQLVYVKFGAHVPPPPDGDIPRFELGLTEGPILFRPVLYQQDIYADDFGPNVPAEVMGNLAEVHLMTTLIHYDADVLDKCIAEGLGGLQTVDTPAGTKFLPPGVLPPAGSLLGNGLNVGDKGCHYVSLNFIPAEDAEGIPYRFPASLLMDSIEIPLGAGRSVARCHWRAIPYNPIAFQDETDTLFSPGGGQQTVLLVSKGGVSSDQATVWDYEVDEGP